MRRIVVLVLLACASCGRIAFEPRDGDAGGMVDLGVDVVAPAGNFVAAYELAVPGTTATIPIVAIDPTRTFITCDFRTASSSVGRQPACELTAPDQVTITVGVPEDTLIVRVQVVQLANARVQRGTHVVTSGEMMSTITIAAVDRARAFPLLSRWSSLDGGGSDPRFHVSAELTADTTVTLRRIETGNTVNLVWQVIEMPDAQVQAGVTTVFAGLTNAVANVPVPLVLGQSFVLATDRTSSSREEDNRVRVSIASANQLVLQRAGMSLDTTVAWYAISLPGSRVTDGSNFCAAATDFSQPIPTVDPARSAAFMTASGGRPTEENDLESTLFTGEVLPTELVLRRDAQTNANGCAVSWLVVEWP